MRIVVGPGGQGGLGNAALSNQKRRAPGFALLGTPGFEGDITLELKTVADVALVGFPSAGKSSLVAAMFVAFNPFLVYFSALILTETLFTTMLAWGMLLITSARSIPWLAGGIILGIAQTVGAALSPGWGILAGHLVFLDHATTERAPRWSRKRADTPPVEDTAPTSSTRRRTKRPSTKM